MIRMTNTVDLNPVFLWSHDKGGLPVGKVIKIWTQKAKEAGIQVQFVPGYIYPWAEQVRNPGGVEA